MFELTQNTPNSTAKQVDEALSEKLQDIKNQFTRLANKYVLFYDKYNQPFEIRPDYTDIKDINKDLKAFMDDANMYEVHFPESEPLTYHLAYLFLTSKVFFKALSHPVLKQLLLRNERAKAAAIKIFATHDCYNKASLLDMVDHFKNKQKLPNYNTLEEDQAFIFFLLSQPKHAAFFNLNELIECVTEVSGRISPCLYKLVLSFNNLLTDWLTSFGTITTTNAPALIAAMAPLTQTELERLLPSDPEKAHLFSLLNDEPKAIEAIIQNWPAVHIQWLINQLCPPAESATHEGLSLLAQTALGKIMEGLFLTPRSDLTIEFTKYTKHKAVLENFPRQYVERCLQIQSNGIAHLAEKQQSLILAVANYPELFPASDRAFFHLLCLKANNTTFASLSEKKQFQIHLSLTAAHPQSSSLYQLISETNEEDKVIAILTGAKAQLQSLSSAELLTLATEIPKGRTAPLLASADLKKILKQRPNDFSNTSADQHSLNLVMDIILRSNKMSRDLFETLMTHRDFQEAWLRSKIFDANWNTLGQGFFSKKVPTTIAKARSFLHTEGKRITPLSPQRLNTLIGMLKEAQTKSHKYFYVFGTRDLRDKKTQSFYTQVAQFPCTPETPTEGIGLVQL